MKQFLCLFAIIAAIGCDSATGRDPDPIQAPVDTVKVDTTKKDTVKPSAALNLTCLEYSKGIPKGTYAYRLLTKEKKTLDSNGCFKFDTAAPVAGRTMANPDSVVFYNDSALFSVTIPYLNGGDTIQVIPTVVSLKNCPNTKVDSVHLAVFDKVNILSRKTKLKKANFGDSSEYGRTLWSVDNGGEFHIHFEIHGENTSYATSVISAEPGGTISLNYVQVRKSSVPSITNIGDSVFFYTDSMYDRTNGDYSKTKTFTNKSLTIEAFSIYGIASIKVDNIASDSIQYSTVNPFKNSTDSANRLNPAPFKTAIISITDSAGYIASKQIKIWHSKDIIIENVIMSGAIEYSLKNDVMFIYK